MYADSLNYSVEAEILRYDSFDPINNSRKHNKKSRQSKYSNHNPPTAPVVLQLLWQLKGLMLGQTYSLPFLCLFIQTAASTWQYYRRAGPLKPQNSHAGFSVMHTNTWIHIQRQIWYEDMIMMHMKIHRSQAESDELSDPAPVRADRCI